MKKLFTLLVVWVFSTGAFPQAPGKMSYQAVIRDAGNALVTNHTVGMQISILQGSVSGTAVYTETQTPTTNTNGLVSIEIGGGTGFDAIDWSEGPYYIKTEIDPTGGTNYTAIVGTSQLLSVPYALHSQTALVANSVSGSISGNLHPPTAITLAATDISPYTATLNGEVNGQGFSTDVVFEWGMSTAYGGTIPSSPNPVTGSSEIAVTANLTGLLAASNYHFRIKAASAVNVTYSNDMTFTTQMVITSPVTSITPNSAVSGGTVIHDGGSPVTGRGVCWSTNPVPTIDDNFTDDGEGTGAYVSNITGLSNSTLYYVRAYATNSSGTYYGDSRILITYYNLMSDYDGNSYGTVLIGTQLWMAENLKTTHYRNGNAIEYPGADNLTWKNNTVGAYAWYENDILWKDNYGALYNWYAATNTNNLCPTGWHVPGNTEWTALTDYLGGLNESGGKLKSTATHPDPHPRWWSPNIGATNEYGFYGVPGGARDYNGSYYGMGGTAYFWSSTISFPGTAVFRMLTQLGDDIMNTYAAFGTGFSVRCIKD